VPALDPTFATRSSFSPASGALGPTETLVVVAAIDVLVPLPGDGRVVPVVGGSLPPTGGVTTGVATTGTTFTDWGADVDGSKGAGPR
jgi:hypothetical protein